MTALGDIRSAVVGLVDGRVFRDVAPPATDYPFITIDDDGATAAYRGDGRSVAFRGLLTVHLWQDAEDDALLPSLVGVLDGLRLATGEGRQRAAVDGWTRVPAAADDPAHLHHTAITVRTAVLTP